MVLSVADALNAYRTTLKGLDGAGEAAPVSGPSFGDVLGGVFDKAVDSIKDSEKVSMAAVKGKASINEVVTAMSSAEMALSTIVTIRDKLLSAYQEVMRSGI